MGFFDLFKKRNPVQAYLDGFFKNMAIVDVVAPFDIPMIQINGNERRAPANIFFREYAKRVPHRIDSYIKDSDAVFWVFDTLFVLELNSTRDQEKQFVVMELVSSRDSERGHEGLSQHLDALEYSIRITQLKEQLLNPAMEVVFFKEAWDFFVRNHERVIEILKTKYSRR